MRNLIPYFLLKHYVSDIHEKLLTGPILISIFSGDSNENLAEVILMKPTVKGCNEGGFLWSNFLYFWIIYFSFVDAIFDLVHNVVAVFHLP